MKTRLATLATLTAVAAIAACSSKPPPPPQPPATTPDAGAVEADAAPAELPDAGAPIANGAPDAGATATAPLAEVALDSVIDLALTSAAPKVAPKMEKEGASGHATLAEGQHFSMMVNMQPNRCYTIVATSAPGAVEKLDLKLFGPPLFNIEAGRSSPTDAKNMPVIGKGTKPLCPIIPLAVPYKIDVGATKGSGRIGVHLYSRAK